MQNLRSKLVVSLLFALLVFVALAFYADAPRLFAAFARFDWRFLPLALAATLANYLIRFVRWHYYLHVIGVEGLTRRDSFLIFFSGFCLTMTPGKLGEVLKSFLLKSRHGTAVSYSASIVFAERLTDVLGVVILAAVGLAFYPLGLGALAVVLAILASAVFVVQQRALAERLLDVFSRLPILGRFAGIARNLYESAYLLLREAAPHRHRARDRGVVRRVYHVLHRAARYRLDADSFAFAASNVRLCRRVALRRGLHAAREGWAQQKPGWRCCFSRSCPSREKKPSRRH